MGLAVLVPMLHASGGRPQCDKAAPFSPRPEVGEFEAAFRDGTVSSLAPWRSTGRARDRLCVGACGPSALEGRAGTARTGKGSALSG